MKSWAWIRKCYTMLISQDFFIRSFQILCMSKKKEKEVRGHEADERQNEMHYDGVHCRKWEGGNYH